MESYWEKSVERTDYPPLTEKTSADVCVIGGGIAGLCTAARMMEKGYAYEACQGIIRESAKRGAVYLHCRIKSGNKASVNLAQKLGFQKINYHLKDDGDDMEVWRYTC